MDSDRKSDGNPVRDHVGKALRVKLFLQNGFRIDILARRCIPFFNGIRTKQIRTEWRNTMRLIKLFVLVITLPVVALLSVMQLILDAAVYLSSIIMAPFIAIGGLLLICCIVRGEMRNTLIMVGVIAAVVLLFTAAGSVYALISSIKRRIRRMTT